MVIPKELGQEGLTDRVRNGGAWLEEEVVESSTGETAS